MTLSRTPWEASIPKWTNATRKPCVSLCACTACLLPRKASHKRHSSLWRPMRRFHGCTNRSLLSFLLLWHRLGRHEKLRFASEPTQRRSLVYALTPHCLLPRKASYKKYYSPGDLWGGGSMDAQIDLFLPSFFLSFCYDIVLDSIRSFNSQVDQRIEEALCLSLCSYTGCFLPRKASHKKTFLSYLLQISSISTNTKIDHRQNVMPNSLRKHHHSTTQTSSNKFLKSLLFTLQWTDLKPTSSCISFSVLGGGGGDPIIQIFTYL